MVLRLALLALLCLVSAPALAQNPTACVTRGDPPFAVFREGGLLTTANSHCVEFPITDTLTSQIDTLSASLPGKWIWLWGNRCTGGPPGGLCNGNNNLNPGGYGFTTPLKADACTLAETLAAQGKTADARNLLLSNTVAINGRSLTDNCLLGPQVTGVLGVAYDYEPCDGRTTNRTLVFAGSAASLAHSFGWQFNLYLHGLTSPCAVSDGVTADNAPFLLQLADYISISADAGGRPDLTSYLQAQLDMLKVSSGADRAKIYVATQIGGMTGAEMQTVHDFVVAQGLGGVDLWKNGADDSLPDGIYWQMLRCLVYKTSCPTP